MVLALKSSYFRSFILLIPILFIITYISTIDTDIKILQIGRQRNFNWGEDYNRLINISFSFTTLPLTCSMNQNMFTILIFTSPNNFHRRKTIREIWAPNDLGVKIYFLLGLTDNETISTQLEEENQIHTDFIQGSFLDSYHNLSYKHVMALKYMFFHCPDVKYLVKLDDDTFVNMNRMMKFLHEQYEIDNHSKRIMGEIRIGHPVLRYGKWKVSMEDYPNDTYPPHCPGYALIYPHDAIFALYPEAQRGSFFWIDDVYVTGMIARDSNVGHVDISKHMFIERGDGVEFSKMNISDEFIMAGYEISEENMRYLYNLTNNSTSTG
ncbi:unnamed protein product [Phaedon cochleariae]|uniref:Hexosyltransferase n=1 Tax=Phaedon cochleariae TaxID=80249 RepID=A0A9N9SGY1_PHACE|nr:unnamed protein product [Phaedon cochleariae]